MFNNEKKREGRGERERISISYKKDQMCLPVNNMLRETLVTYILNTNGVLGHENSRGKKTLLFPV